MTKALRVLLINLALITVTLLLAELSVRWWGFEPYVRTFPGEHPNGPAVPWACKNPQLGWVSPSDQELEKEYGGEWTINRQGFRDPSDFNQPQSAVFMRIVVLGDSFMWGAGIEMDETLPALLQARLGPSHRVFNVSAPGWGIDQMYLAYEQYKRILKPEVVILAYVDDDVNRVLEAYRIYEKLNKPVLSIQGDTLTRRGPVSEGEYLLNGVARRSVLFSFFMREYFLLSEANPIVRQIFTEISRDTTDAGDRFIVLRISTIDNDSLQQRMRRAISNFPALSMDGSFLYLDPADELTDFPHWQRKFYLDDGHMNRAGNLFLLNYICRHAFQDC